ncbi:hypothetical protein [Bradyrhizobium sp. CCGUVB23]|uniref:hypothetical protein n=1 Tax=Bradyrhizobium sp. CCGUVB23 TaxID=2949630 RepID=UPI0020B38D0E|nr:hypothetical protein [Bradyrhizobium sp. CCGUVB23]MCP3463252.1 hypothetical protein [Bradyrhizobium sp. CCGUVB23]
MLGKVAPAGTAFGRALGRAGEVGRRLEEVVVSLDEFKPPISNDERLLTGGMWTHVDMRSEYDEEVGKKNNPFLVDVTGWDLIVDFPGIGPAGHGWGS